jgi:membrane protease YdiL (CAAX protease family)
MKSVYRGIQELFAFRRVSGVDLLLTVFLTVIVSTFGTVFINFLIDVFPQQAPDGLEVVTTALKNADGAVLASFLFGVCVFAPVVEEVLFRGWIWWAVEKAVSPIAALVVTTLLFAVAHVDILHIVAVLPLGCLLGYLRLKTRSIWAPLVAHALNNILASLALLL